MCRSPLISCAGLLCRADHKFIDVGYARDFIRDVRLVAEQRGVAVRSLGVVAVHSPDWTFAHVAGHDYYPLIHKENHLAEIAVGEHCAEPVQFLIGQDMSMGYQYQACGDRHPAERSATRGLKA